MTLRRLLPAIAAILMCAAIAQAQKIKHPSLLFTPDRVETAKKAVKNDSVMARAWQQIKAVADE